MLQKLGKQVLYLKYELLNLLNLFQGRNTGMQFFYYYKQNICLLNFDFIINKAVKIQK